MNVFTLRDRLIADYHAYVRSFLQIRDPRLRSYVEESLTSGVLWPDPLIQLNPAFESGNTIDDLVKDGVLHRECGPIFRLKRDQRDTGASPPRSIGTRPRPSVSPVRGATMC